LDNIEMLACNKNLGEIVLRDVAADFLNAHSQSPASDESADEEEEEWEKRDEPEKRVPWHRPVTAPISGFEPPLSSWRASNERRHGDKCSSHNHTQRG
jgi:hypothetical protein